MRDSIISPRVAAGQVAWIVRSLGAGFIGCLALAFAVAGCSRSDVADEKESMAKSTAALAPTEISVRERVENPQPVLADDPSTRKRGDEEPVELRSRGAVFMGTHAVGKRFCIIADASQSMRGSPLLQVKQEITRTLNDLEPSSQFYVIFFNATDIPMPAPGWLDASKKNVEEVSPWIQNMSTKLRTLPCSAFERAFRLQPRPDVIFFMTDGFLQGPDPIQRLGTLNSSEPKVIVHTIMFAKQKATEKPNFARATSQLRAMAEKNGGTFRHVSQK